jgi:hypothetical protein
MGREYAFAVAAVATDSTRPISAINGFEMTAPKQPLPPMPRPLLLSLPDSATISDSESQEEVR